MQTTNQLSLEQQKTLLNMLKTRFEGNMQRHKGLEWDKVQGNIVAQPEKMWALNEMERTGGEPDVIVYMQEYFFVDCSPESPSGRRSLCYDTEALNARKEHKPKDSAVNMVENMGIELLTEEYYRALQQLGKFDTKTSSWIQTPREIRKRGGAIFADRRYEHVFVYHNGADSYYASRGFRGFIRLHY